MREFHASKENGQKLDLLEVLLSCHLSGTICTWRKCKRPERLFSDSLAPGWAK